MDAVLVSLLTWPTIDVLHRTMGTSRSHHVDSPNPSDLVTDLTLFGYVLQYGNFEQINWILSSLSPLQIDEVLAKGIDNNPHSITKQLHHAIKENKTATFEAIMQFLIKKV